MSTLPVHVGMSFFCFAERVFGVPVQARIVFVRRTRIRVQIYWNGCKWRQWLSFGWTGWHSDTNGIREFKLGKP